MRWLDDAKRSTQLILARQSVKDEFLASLDGRTGGVETGGGIQELRI
jgi:hypothetical protein